MNNKIIFILILSLGIIFCIQSNYVFASNSNQTILEESPILNNNNSNNASFANYGSKYVPNQIIIRYNNTTSKNTQNQIYKNVSDSNDISIKVLDESKIIYGLNLIEVSDNTKLINLIEDFRLYHEVLYASPNYIVQASFTPNDPYFSQQWGLQNTGQTLSISSPYGPSTGTPDADINAVEAWNITKGNNTIKIAVIDTGVDYTHPDLSANMWKNPDEIPNDGIDNDNNGFIDDVYGWDFYSNDNDPADEYGHGTHCAGIIGAVGNNNIGVTGVMFNVSIIPVRCFGPTGSGNDYDIIQGIVYAINEGASIISCSFGGGPFNDTYKDIINPSDALFVIAAGNDGSDNDLVPEYPASYDSNNIISVAATNNQDQLASFSNYGANSVDLAAPGVDILSTWPLSKTKRGYLPYAWLSGTSMATPFVAGVAGLIKSINPFLTNLQIKDLILDNVDPLNNLAGKMLSGGRLNAYQAVIAAALPDLTALQLDDASSVLKDNSIQITSTILNQGVSNAGSSTAKFYLSTDNNITSSNIFLGQINIPYLISGASDTQISTFIIPSNINIGNYFIGIIIDVENQVLESNENNNILASSNPISIIRDLIITNLTGSTTGAIGNQIDISSTIGNQGNIDINNSFQVNYLLSTDMIYQANDYLLGSVIINGLNANTETIIPYQTFIVPINVPIGSNYILIIADSLFNVSESDESNNEATQAINVIAAPEISSIDPLNNTVDVPIKKVINITFSDVIKAGNNYLSDIIVKSMSDNNITIITPSINENSLTISADYGWDEGTEYMIYISRTAITDLTGNNLTTSYTSYFTTDYFPYVINIIPGNNSLNVPSNMIINITFSEPVMWGTKFIQLLANGTALPISAYTMGIISNGKNLIIKHPTLFATNTLYTILLNTGCVMDYGGNDLALTSSCFTTTSDGTAPSVKTPLSGTITNITPTQSMTINFSEPVKWGSRWIEIQVNGVSLSSTAFTKSLSSNFMSLIIKSTTSWAVNSTYKVLLHTGCVIDYAGNSLAVTNRIFTIDTIAPSIKTPLSGTITNITPTQSMTINFSEPVKWGSRWIEIQVNGVSLSSTAFTKSLSSDGNTLTIKPVTGTLWTANTTYTIIFHTGCVTDIAGNNLTVTSRKFKTGSI